MQWCRPQGFPGAHCHVSPKLWKVCAKTNGKQPSHHSLTVQRRIELTGPLTQLYLVGIAQPHTLNPNPPVRFDVPIVLVYTTWNRPTHIRSDLDGPPLRWWAHAEMPSYNFFGFSLFKLQKSKLIHQTFTGKLPGPRPGSREVSWFYLSRQCFLMQKLFHSSSVWWLYCFFSWVFSVSTSHLSSICSFNYFYSITLSCLSLVISSPPRCMPFTLCLSLYLNPFFITCYRIILWLSPNCQFIFVFLNPFVFCLFAALTALLFCFVLFK